MIHSGPLVNYVHPQWMNIDPGTPVAAAVPRGNMSSVLYLSRRQERFRDKKIDFLHA